MTPETLPYEINSRRLNEVEIEYAVAGQPGSPVVILLHGFPDLWQGWHFQVPRLVAAGFRVLAPNQRGYGKSSKPTNVSDYDIDHLASDVLALADAEGCRTFSLIGHDWGGIVAWWVAARAAERVARLVVLNAPHPGVFQNYAFHHPSQLLRSWYVGFFQLPWIPEAVLSVNNYALLFRSVKHTSRPGIFDDSDRRYFVAAWSQPGALTAMINYYRAAARRSAKSLEQRVRVSTLILFGKRDPAEEPGLAEASLSLCDDARLVWLEQSRHWIQREEPEQVTDEILSFLSSQKSITLPRNALP
jgi:epoxide hydrolase 4